MGGRLTKGEGEYIVLLARKAISAYLKNGERIRPERGDGALGENRGVFVTLETFPGKELRGCIGYPLPIKPLSHAVVDNAINAATEDPRFPQLRQGELGSIVIEVSALTVPEKIIVKKPLDYIKNIKVGEDGLIVSYGYSSGLLLPQVPVELGWSPREFLSQTCKKAGLPPDMWLSANISISKFQAQVFSEKEPNGSVIERKLVE